MHTTHRANADATVVGVLGEEVVSFTLIELSRARRVDSEHVAARVTATPAGTLPG